MMDMGMMILNDFPILEFEFELIYVFLYYQVYINNKRKIYYNLVLRYVTMFYHNFKKLWDKVNMLLKIKIYFPKFVYIDENLF